MRPKPVRGTQYTGEGGKEVMANQIGKRYNCTKCGSEFIVTKAGNGEINCCGQPMELKK
jgi:desulfoferrodoxin-like iron-binding protein